jgi:hypothetical protein
MAASGTTKKITSNQILGAGGTATLASATITGAATVGTTLGVTGVSTFAAGTALLPALTTTGDVNTGIYYPAADTFAVTTGGTERLRVDSSGNVGVGIVPNTWSSAYKFVMLPNGGSLFNDTTNSIYLAANYYALAGGKKIASGYALNYLLDAANGAYKWFTSAVGAGNAGDSANLTQAMTLDASGNLSLANGNVVMGTSGKGIDFSAVTGGTGTATANVLNDYEEGTFTATLNGSVTNPATLLTTVGKYTKIGRTVTAQVFFSNIITTGYSGRISISGLPFANGTVETVASAGFYGAATFTGSIFGLCTASGTAINMYSSVSNSAFADVTFNPGSVQYIWANLTYTV